MPCHLPGLARATAVEHVNTVTILTQKLRLDIKYLLSTSCSLDACHRLFQTEQQLQYQFRGLRDLWCWMSGII